jgi:hypothetical protein
MKPDEKWRHLSAEAHAARKVLDEVLAPVLKKLSGIAAGTSDDAPLPEEDVQLQAAMDVWKDVNTQIEEFIAESVGRR